MRVQTATAWAAEAARDGVDEAIAASAGNRGRCRSPAPKDGRAGRASARSCTPSSRSCRSTPAEEIVRRTAESRGGSSRRRREKSSPRRRSCRAVLRHDLMARARASARLRRETPITWTQKRRHADRRRARPGVRRRRRHDRRRDFKTDHELAAGEARYRAQLQKYVDAVAAATGRPARGVLFKV